MTSKLMKEFDEAKTKKNKKKLTTNLDFFSKPDMVFHNLNQGIFKKQSEEEE